MPSTPQAKASKKLPAATDRKAMLRAVNLLDMGRGDEAAEELRRNVHLPGPVRWAAHADDLDALSDALRKALR